MKAWYNEIDPFKAAWLRELIKRGLITPGVVDERSIADVQPAELLGYTQCHFFAGIGVWSYALRCAGWPDERPVWTASTPCPSFSAAGKGLGFSDPRHLWPEVERLARVNRPPVLFGEQVASAIGHGWLDLVQADLEALDYAVGKAVLGACSVGAPHIRQRLYFVAVAGGENIRRRRNGGSGESPGPSAGPSLERSGGFRTVGLLEHSEGQGCGISRDAAQPGHSGHADSTEQPLGVGEPQDSGLQERQLHTGSVRQADGASTREGSERRSDAGKLADADGADPGDGGVQRSRELRQQPQDGCAGPWQSYSRWFGVCWHPSECGNGCQCGNRTDAPAGWEWDADEGWVQSGSVADAELNDGRTDEQGRRPDQRAADGGDCSVGELDDARRASDESRGGVGNLGRAPDHQQSQTSQWERGGNADCDSGSDVRPSPLNGFWRDADWIGFRDGKFRPVEPGAFPLAAGAPARVGRLRGYGDAIVAPVAQAFIEAYIETMK